MGNETLKSSIYVACLAAYNDGFLHGVWIDADQSVADIQRKIDAMLRASPAPGAEEFEIHDYEGFGGLRVKEYSEIDTLSRIAAFVTEYGALGVETAQRFDGDIEKARASLLAAKKGALPAKA